MNNSHLALSLTILISLSLNLLVTPKHSFALVDDRNPTISTKTDVINKRNKLLQYIWGKYGFPKSKLPSSVNKNVISPVMNLPNLEQVDTLHITMDNGIQGLSHHFIPKKKNNRVVILHLGHTDNCTFNDGAFREPDIGMSRTMKRLLSKGFAVLALYMPHTSIEDCTGGHDGMFDLVTSGSPMKFFLEPTAVSLNYLQANFPNYYDYSMIGLSGGGWTTTVYAAVDPRIKRSISIAGTVPLYLRYEDYNHDKEQFIDSFYNIAGYLDLYILGSYGSGRKQIQVLNRFDDAAFGEKQHKSSIVGMPFKSAVHNVEAKVNLNINKLGSGHFSVYIDERAPRHEISNNTIEKVIIPTLR